MLMFCQISVKSSTSLLPSAINAPTLWEYFYEQKKNPIHAKNIKKISCVILIKCFSYNLGSPYRLHPLRSKFVLKYPSGKLRETLQASNEIIFCFVLLYAVCILDESEVDCGWLDGWLYEMRCLWLCRKEGSSKYI